MDLRAVFGPLAVGVVAAFFGVGCARDVPTTLPTPTPNQGPPVQTRALTLSGQVFEVADGIRKPVGGAEVDICDSAKCPHGQPVLTGDDGNYTVTANASGPVAARAVKSGYRMGFSTPVTDGGSSTADVEVALRHILSVLVVEPTPTGARALPGAQVLLCDDSACGGAWDSVNTTGDDGRVTVEFSGPVSYYLRVRMSGYQEYRPEAAVAVVGSVNLTVELARE